LAARRQKRVAQALKQEISTIILQELDDPRLGFVTVTGVKVTPDLRSAQVMVSILGDPVGERLTMKALRSAQGHIQQGIADRLELRYTPALRFVVDDTVKRSIRLSKIIRDVVEESGGQEPVSD